MPPKEISMEGFSNFADVGHAWWIKPARLARTPIEISFVVGITVAVFSQICQSIDNMMRGFCFKSLSGPAH